MKTDDNAVVVRPKVTSTPYLEWEDYGYPIPDSFLLLRIGPLRVLIADVLSHRTEEGPNDFLVRPHDASQLLFGKVEAYYPTLDEAKAAVYSIYSQQIPGLTNE